MNDSYSITCINVIKCAYHGCFSAGVKLLTKDSTSIVMNPPLHFVRITIYKTCNYSLQILISKTTVRMCFFLILRSIFLHVINHF